MARLDKLLVVDIECTCWNTSTERAENTQDIIEIGVCLYDFQSQHISDVDGIVIRPLRSKVGSFCTEMTGITPEMTDNGVTFFQATEALMSRYRSRVRPWASWGTSTGK